MSNVILFRTRQELSNKRKSSPATFKLSSHPCCVRDCTAEADGYFKCTDTDGKDLLKPYCAKHLCEGSISQ